MDGLTPIIVMLSIVVMVVRGVEFFKALTY